MIMRSLTVSVSVSVSVSASVSVSVFDFVLPSTTMFASYQLYISVLNQLKSIKK